MKLLNESRNICSMNSISDKYNIKWITKKVCKY